MFQNLNSLKLLNLGNNTIKQIEDGAFRSLTSLQTLILSKNLIRDLEPKVFEGMVKKAGETEKVTIPICVPHVT